MSVKTLLALKATVLFGVFILFSFLVSKEVFNTLDFDTTVRLQDHLSRRWDLPFSVLSVIGSAEITGLIWGAIFIYCLFKKYFKVLLTLPLFFVALFIEVFGKVFVEHPAPPFLFYRGVLDFHFPSNFVHTSYSYPSGHMTRTAFLVAFLLTFSILKTKGLSKLVISLILVSFLTLMCISRVYLGEHWLSDVIGGSLLGLSFGIIPALFVPQKTKKIQFLG